MTVANHPALSDWYVEEWFISGQLTGYRVVQRGPRGYVDVADSFTADLYEPGSTARAKSNAEAVATRLNGD